MKRIRRTLALVVVLTMAVALLAACGGDQESQTTTPPSQHPDQSTQPPSGPSAKDQIYDIIAVDPLGLNGIPERNLSDRTNIDKALPQEQRGNLTIGYTAPFMGAPFFIQLADRMQELCDEYGYTLIVQNANFNIQTQLAQVEAFITQQVDAIIINGLDLPSTVPVMNAAVEANIPVLLTSGRAGRPEYPSVLSMVSNASQSGFMTGCYAAQRLFVPGQTLKAGVVIIELGASDSESRTAGFIAGWLYESRRISGNPYPTQWEAILDGFNAWKRIANEGRLDFSAEAGLNFVALGQSHSPDANGGQSASADMITAHPDIDLVFIENDAMYFGVEVNLRQNGLTPGEDVYVVCAADGTRDGMDAIRDGRVLCIGNNSSMMIAEGMINLIKQIFEENFDANNMPGVVFTPTDVICIENLDYYYDPNLDLARGIPFEFYTIEEYNLIAGETDSPFPVPNY